MEIMRLRPGITLIGFPRIKCIIIRLFLQFYKEWSLTREKNLFMTVAFYYLIMRIHYLKAVINLRSSSMSPHASMSPYPFKRSLENLFIIHQHTPKFRILKYVDPETELATVSVFAYPKAGD